VKRLFDLVLVVLAAPVWVPVVAVVALTALVVQGRPVFFTQLRAGRGGRPFRLYKFRSMRPGVGADAERLTRFGRWLRATSLDELPELINVLKGEMSLVGPRPWPVEYLPRYTREESRRHEVLPGITGWAQVNGRNCLAWEKRICYDIEYVERHSLAFDLKILLWTVVRVFSAAGISAEGEATSSEFRPEGRPSTTI